MKQWQFYLLLSAQLMILGRLEQDSLWGISFMVFAGLCLMIAIISIHKDKE